MPTSTSAQSLTIFVMMLVSFNASVIDVPTNASSSVLLPFVFLLNAKKETPATITNEMISVSKVIP